MCDLCFEGTWKWKLHFLQVICFFLSAVSPPAGYGYFLGDTKAVLNGCENHWTFQSPPNTAMLELSQMTVCMDIRVVVPGAWVAFSYGSAYAPNPDLGVEGDTQAIYVWLLQVRHRFPAHMSPTHWHSICLRRDVLRNMLSLEVNGTAVAERTVIAQTILPSGFLWLGCRHRNQLSGVELGKVELYMFRMWADLGVHEACEEGTVISWNAQHWAVTSSKAKETDPYLPCDHKRFRREANLITATTDDVDSGTESGNNRLLSPGTPLLNCGISQLCSNQNAFFWMLLSVEAEESNKTKQEVHKLVSEVFACNSDGSDTVHEVMTFKNFCQADGQLQVVEVSCRGNNAVNIWRTTCGVLLLLSHAVSECDLQSVGESALQRAGGAMQARIIGNVERVGQNLCENVLPSNGSFVRCTSTSSLDDICQSNKTSDASCSLFDPNSEPRPHPRTNLCPRPEPCFCNCTAFCDTANQFYAIKINITSDIVQLDNIKTLLLKPSSCHTQPWCINYMEISNNYKGAHLKCHGTKERLYNCMVVLEMSGPVNDCSLSNLVHQIIDENKFITSYSTLTRMMLCGPPGLSVYSLLAFNLTWVDSDKLPSDICQPDSIPFECEANETFAVLLADSCSPKPQTSLTTHATTQTYSVTAAPGSTPPSVTYTTEDSHPTVTYTHSTNTQSQTEQPVLQTSSHHLTETVPRKTTETLSENTSTPSNNNSILHSITTFIDNPKLENSATLVNNSTTTLSPKHTKAFNITTTEAITVRDHATVSNVTTPSVFTSNETPKYKLTTLTASPSHTPVYNRTAVTTNHQTSTNNYQNLYDETSDKTENNDTTLNNSVFTGNTSTASTFPPNDIVTQNVTSQNISSTKVLHVTTDKSNHITAILSVDSNYTASAVSKNDNAVTLDHKLTTVNNTATPSNNYATIYGKNTTSNYFTAVDNATSLNNVHTTIYNTTTPSKMYITAYNTKSPSNSYTIYKETTTTKSHTTSYNVTSHSISDTTVYNATQPSSIHTSKYNNTIPSNIYDATYNATTPSNNYTNTYNGPTPSNVNPTTYEAPAPSNFNLNTYNATTPSNIHSNTYKSTTSSNFLTTTYNATTPSDIHTVALNATKPSNIPLNRNNVTTPNSSYRTTYNVTLTYNNLTTEMFNVTSPRSIHTTTYNATMQSNIHLNTYNATTPNSNNRTTYNATLTSNIHTTAMSNTTTPRNIPTTTLHTTALNNIYSELFSVTIRSKNDTAAYNATTPSNIYSQLIPATTLTKNNTTNNATTSNIHTAVHHTTIPNNNYSTTYSTTPNNNNHTEVYNTTSHSNFNTNSNITITTSNISTTRFNATTPMNNYATGYNLTKPSNNYTTVDNATTPTNNYSITYSAIPLNSNQTAHKPTTPSNIHTNAYNSTTPTTNYRTTNNETTLNNIFMTEYNTSTPVNNYSITYSAIPLNSNQTTAHNPTTPSNIHTNAYNSTTPTTNYINNIYTTADSTTIPINISTSMYNATTPSNIHTAILNATTPSKSYTSLYNAITHSTSYTAFYNTTIPSNIHITAYGEPPSKNYTTLYNAAMHNNNNTALHNATTPSNNYIAMYNANTTRKNDTFDTTTSTNNYTTINNAITQSNNYPSMYNTTASSINFTTAYNTTTTSNSYTTLHSITTPSKNDIPVFNATTYSNNFTTVYNITAALSNNATLHNATKPTTILTSHTATYSTKTPSNNYTAIQNGLGDSTTTYSAATHSNNYTTSMTIPPATISQSRTIAFKTTTVPIREPQWSTIVTGSNTTLISAATSATDTTHMKNSTGEHTTSFGDNMIKPTKASLNNYTTKYTTVRVTDMTTDSKNSTAASSIYTTKAPVHLTTTADPSLALPTTATTTTTHNPDYKNSTTALLSSTYTTSTRQTTSLTTTITTISSTATTSVTTEKTTTSKKNEDEQANELLTQTQNATQLNSSQVSNLLDDLDKLLEGPSVSQSVGQKITNVFNNLMSGDSSTLSQSANRLIHLVDTLGLKLEVTGDSGILSSASLVLAVRTVEGTNFPTTSIDIFSTDNIQLHALNRSRLKRSGSALGSVYLPSSLTAGLNPEEQRWASRVQFTFYTRNSFFKDAALDNQTVVSPVLGSSVANLSISNLKENIRFTIRNNNPVQASNTSCVFWDFTLNSGEGGWRSDGCSVVGATPEYTNCSCNHLTSFAILMDLSRQGITDHKQTQILTFITYIGCGISCVFLAFTLLTHFLFKKLLRDIPAKILVQLCLSLLLLNLVFLLNGWLSMYSAVGLCISTAFFLHYFLLTTFTWAGLEALHMYLSIVQVFTPYLSRYMLKFSLMGWGIPLIVVITVIAVDKNNYGLVTYGKYTDGRTDDFCWLRNDIVFYVAVVAYFLLIFILCLVVFIVVMIQLNRIKKQNPHNQSPNRGLITDIRSIIGLIVLLGLTWGFALFAWGDLYLPFVYLFSLFNSLQGFFVFIFHCAVKENVRRQWRTYLCCGKLRLAENSDWSRMATQNRNLSAANITNSDPHFIFHNTSVVSVGPNNTSSVFWDNKMSDHSNSDVILNEIHKQHLSRQGKT